MIRKNTVKIIACQVFIFLITLFLLTGVLVLSTGIPDDGIKNNMLRSAEELNEHEVFFDCIEGIASSKIDRYADSILLSIAWQLDGDKPLESVMWTSFYSSPIINENLNFLNSLENNYEANTQYMRYWHGSAAIVRFLHLFLSLYGIYVLNGILILFLTGILAFMMIKRRLYSLAAGLILSLVMTASWFVPLSLEYTWTVLLMLLFMLFILIKTSGRPGSAALKDGTSLTAGGFIPLFFMISGMLTSYLDFLTTETLTLLMPLITLVCILYREYRASFKECRNCAAGAVISWGAGYVLMWVSKWILASLILKENMLPYVKEHVDERLSGDIGLSPISYITGAVTRNFNCLFPFNFGALGIISGIALIIFAAYLLFVYRAKKPDTGLFPILIFLGLIPVIRFVLLHNHSFIHYFFTFRALAAGIFAAVIMMAECIDWGLLQKRKA